MYEDILSTFTQGHEKGWLTHGSRHGLGGSLYEDILSTFTQGHEKGWLTPEGEVFYQAYRDFYPSVARREGNLTLKGQNQHRFIAAQIYKNSMFFFLSQLDNTDRDFTFAADYGQPYQSYLLPDIIDSNAERSGSAEEKFNAFRDEVLDLDALLAKWFTQPDSLVTRGKYKFCYDMHTLVSTLDNLDVPAPQELYEVYTPEERYRLWRVKNYRDYQIVGPSPDTQNLRVQAMRPLLDDILEKAETDWQNGVQLRLRFAHDSTLMPLLSLMGVNDMGVRVENPYEAAATSSWSFSKAKRTRTSWSRFFSMALRPRCRFLWPPRAVSTAGRTSRNVTATKTYTSVAVANS